MAIFFSDAANEVWKTKLEGLVAVGINCTEGKHIESLLASLGEESIPLVIYPNFADGEIIKEVKQRKFFQGLL